MKKLILSGLLLFLSFFISCTKEVPEKENKVEKDKELVTGIFRNITEAYNKRAIDRILIFYSSDYVNSTPEDNELYGIEHIKEEFTNTKELYPDSFLEINIEEIEISGNLAYAKLKSHIKVNYGKNYPKETRSSKSSFEILKKQDDGNWKIVRSMGFQILTYDED